MRESGSPTHPAYPAWSAHPPRHRGPALRAPRRAFVTGIRTAPALRTVYRGARTRGSRRQPLDKGAERAGDGATMEWECGARSSERVYGGGRAGIKAKEKKIIKFVRAPYTRKRPPPVPATVTAAAEPPRLGRRACAAAKKFNSF